MSQKNPLAVVNEDFGGKDKLVDKLVGLLESDESKDDLRKRLLGVANRKLLRLHRVASTVKETYGSRDALLQQAAGTQVKDKDYVNRLGDYSTARLVDLARVATRKSKAASAAAAGTPVRKTRAAAKPRAERARAKAEIAAKGKAAAKGRPVKAAKKPVKKLNKARGR